MFGVLPRLKMKCAGSTTDGSFLFRFRRGCPHGKKAYKPVPVPYPQEERQLAVTLDVEGELGVPPGVVRRRASWTISAALSTQVGAPYPSLFDGPVTLTPPSRAS